MKHEYREGIEVRKEFERTMVQLFHAPKQEIVRKPKKATSRKSDEKPDKD